MLRALKVADVLIPASSIVWIEKADNETIAIYTTNTGDGGAGYDVVTVTTASDTTQATLDAFNQALLDATSPKTLPRSIFEVSQASSVAIG
jgi:Ca2+-binding RTX toxin-like protein